MAYGSGRLISAHGANGLVPICRWTRNAPIGWAHCRQADYHAVLAWSDVHLYLTVPFVLSWSLIEAMAARCCIVGSATPPVEELLQDGHSARLVDFFDVSAQVRAIGELLDNPEQRQRLAAAAAQKLVTTHLLMV